MAIAGILWARSSERSGLSWLGTTGSSHEEVSFKVKKCAVRTKASKRRQQLFGLEKDSPVKKKRRLLKGMDPEVVSVLQQHLTEPPAEAKLLVSSLSVDGEPVISQECASFILECGSSKITHSFGVDALRGFMESYNFRLAEGDT